MSYDLFNTHTEKEEQERETIIEATTERQVDRWLGLMEDSDSGPEVFVLQNPLYKSVPFLFIFPFLHPEQQQSQPELGSTPSHTGRLSFFYQDVDDEVLKPGTSTRRLSITLIHIHLI